MNDMKYLSDTIYKLGLMLGFLWLSIPAVSQVTVSNSIDSLQLLIGEQTKVHIKVLTPKLQKIKFPVFNDSLVRGIEVLETYKPDTNTVNGHVKITQSYLITSFDSAVYIIPPMPVMVGTEEYSTNPLALKVITVPVDTTHLDQFFGPDDIHDASYEWSDFLLIAICGGVALLLLGISIFLLFRIKENRPIVRIIKKAPKRSPYEEAMLQIEEVKRSNLAHGNDLKTYYTQLTDILRTYLKQRFGFNALEMTSSEIIEKLREVHDAQSITDLRTLLETADLVKFAKYTTELNENDRNLMTAVSFIDSTKTVMTEAEPQEQTHVEVVSGRSVAKQRLLLGVVGVLVILMVVCIVIALSDFIDLIF